MTVTVDATPAWQALAAHSKTNPRGSAVTVTAGDFTADLSRQPASAETWKLLHALATQEDVAGAIGRLFASHPVNSSENRAAEHWALRQQPLRPELATVDAGLTRIADKLRAGRWHGSTGLPIETVVNIGIGGSDLGPRLLASALPRSTKLNFRFIANIDPVAMQRALDGCDPETTLFIIASKSFGTLETKLNALACRSWLQDHLGTSCDLGPHFLAVTSNMAAATEFGVPAAQCFDFPDTIGGRYSVWGPIGLVARIALGNDGWDMLRFGARTMDEHFSTAAPEQNLPLILALLSIWHINFCGHDTHAVLPYAEALSDLPAYLQQLVMESNGKNVTQGGAPVTYATAPITFGAAGTTGQHSFYQLLHQGTTVVPSDIIIVQHALPGMDAEAHRWLVASGIAQADALWQGRQNAALPPHRQFAGQRPVALLSTPALSPDALGQLLALYEHKTFVQSIIWRINAFDQWGVELGKELAGQIHAQMGA